MQQTLIEFFLKKVKNSQHHSHMSLSSTATAWTPSPSASEWTPSSDASEWTPTSATTTTAAHYIAVDVECVATGKSYKNRAVGLIAAVDAYEQTVFFEYVRPDVPVVSPMTVLTGITHEHMQTARPLEEVMVDLRKLLGENCILVGHGLKSDIAWLGLKKGVDFIETRDTAKLFAVRTSAFNNSVLTPSLRHLGLAMFGVDMQSGVHSPVIDALYAMKLYQAHMQFTEAQLMHAKQLIVNTPRPSPIAQRYPYIDGCELSVSISLISDLCFQIGVLDFVLFF